MMHYRGIEVSGGLGWNPLFAPAAAQAAASAPPAAPPSSQPATNPGFWSALVGATASVWGGQQQSDIARANARIAEANARASNAQQTIVTGPAWVTPALIVGGVVLVAGLVYLAKR